LCRKMPVYLFDHTIEGLPFNAEGFTFFREGVTDQDTHIIFDRHQLIKGVRVGGLGVWLARRSPYILYNCMHSILYQLHRLGLERKPIVLKMDVEGCEYSALEAFPEENLEHVVALILEIHDLEKPEGVASAISLLRRLRSSLTLIHIHGNNWGATVEVMPGLSYPGTIELTFVNNRFVSERWLANGPFPTILDQPCHPGRSDVSLSFCTSDIIHRVCIDNEAKSKALPQI